MLHGNICSFTRDCQRGEMLVHVHEGLPERGKCCTVTYYDARSRGIARGGNVAR